MLVMASVTIIYDITLTLGDEVEFVWSYRKFSKAQLLWVLVNLIFFNFMYSLFASQFEVDLNLSHTNRIGIPGPDEKRLRVLLKRLPIKAWEYGLNVRFSLVNEPEGEKCCHEIDTTFGPLLLTITLHLHLA